MHRKVMLGFLAIINLAACSNAYPANPQLPSITSPSVPLPTITPPSENVKNQCFEVLPALPPEVTLPGILVLSSPDGLSLQSFSQRNLREIPGLINGVGVSPDRKWLSYVFISEDVDEKIVIESADGNVQIEVPTMQGWLIFDKLLWLDNERLWFPVFPKIMKGEVAPTVVINPFIGMQQEILSDYPGIKRYQFDFSTSPGLHLGYSSVVYHPSLNLVIYPQEAEDGWYIVLWDRQAKKALAKIPDGGLYGHMPLWLPDGSYFVVVARPDWDSAREWLMVSRDGKMYQLTHFEDLYPQFEIGTNASISPDGHYLAFGLSQNPDSNSNSPKELVILDLKTLEVTNTCITFDYPEPVWSPDGQYVTVLTHDSINKSSAIVVLDITQGWATEIIKEPRTKPVGWLETPR